MACRPGRLNQEQDRIGVAIDTDFDYPLNVAAGRTLMPQFLPAARPEVRLTCFKREPQRISIHISQHQDLMGVYVLYDRGREAALIPLNIDHGYVTAEVQKRGGQLAFFAPRVSAVQS
jgi:hypothetical protein